LALSENTSSIARLSSMPSMIADPHDAPGGMSRGATQHRMFLLSSAPHTASATCLS
jgi:hypothetical protein